MSKYKTSNLIRRKKIRQWWRIGLSIFFVATVIYGLSFWSNDKYLAIQSVEISGNRFVETDFIDQAFQQEISGKYFGLFAKRNFLLLPRRDIIKNIRTALPIERVAIRLDGINKVEIEITEYKPWGTWCAEKCYFVNDRGLIFVETPDFIADDTIILISNLLKDETPLGQQFIEIELAQNFATLIKLISDLDIQISEISTEDRETFHLSTKSGPYILVDKDDDPIMIAKNLETTLEQESIHKIQFNNLEYIDLRFENKAYYKIK